MKKSRPYQSISIKQVCVASLVQGHPSVGCDVGLDCSKHEVLAVVRWHQGGFERPWRVGLHEGELSVLIEKLQELRQGRTCAVALEPTGSYSDPVRQALVHAGFQVFKIHTKASHDYAEVFDGVASQHDGKDAACVAELCAIGKRSPWRDLNENSALRHEIDWLDHQGQLQGQWLARLEGQLGRCWPEVTGLLRLSSVSLIGILRHYGGPERLREDPEVQQQLAKLSRGGLKPDKIQKVIQSARETIGVRQHATDIAQMQRYAEEAWRHHQAISKSKTRVAELVQGQPLIERLARVVGTTTAAVCWAYLGNPQQYHSGGAYLKAMGLNLKERSSGRYQGQLKISKRGPSRPRRWLYFAALRTVQTSWVRPWYEAKKRRGKGCGQRAIIAIMRKIALAMYQIAKQDQPYSEQTLVPGAAKYQRRLAAARESKSKKTSQRKTKVHAKTTV